MASASSWISRYNGMEQLATDPCQNEGPGVSSEISCPSFSFNGRCLCIQTPVGTQSSRVVLVATVKDYRLFQKFLDPVEIRVTEWLPFRHQNQRVRP